MPALDFNQAVEAHRRELHVHCYRMVGSYSDAEDLVQETLLRAWRNQGTFEVGTNLRAWLYRIATNVCIDTIRSKRRQVPTGGELAEVTWLEPYPDIALDQIAATDDAPDSVAVGRETMELAFIAAIQSLPLRQRAVLVLSTGLSWAPAEIVGALGMTPAAVNSALQRARETLRRRLPEDRGRWRAPELSHDERTVLRRFIDIHEQGDAAGAVALMREDLVATMPPDPMAHRGLEPMRRNIEIAFGPSGMGRWHAVPVLANRQPAAACYVCRPGRDTYEAFKLDVLTVVGGRVAETVTFDAARFGDFGLPWVWSDELPRLLGARPRGRRQPMTDLSPTVRALFGGPNMAHLATLLPDGAPHSVPLWIGVEDDQIAFLTGPGSRKARNVAADPRVAISITDREQPFTMATIRGRVTERIEGDRAWEIIDRIATTYTGGPYPQRSDRVVYLVEPEQVMTTAF